MIRRTAIERGELDRLIDLLGPAARLNYAPPNIYPMSAPRFTAEMGTCRPNLDGSRLGLYVHIPFCSYHCNFCFYATKIGATADQMQRYVDALSRELTLVSPGTPLTQMYIGGGTPTSLPATLLDKLLENVFARVRRDGPHVHTAECSPESLTDEHLEVFERWGIERVSMGVQTLNEDVLDTVERKHAAATALNACQRILAKGRLLNVDLIYGLPGQTHDSFLRDFAASAEAGVHSITAYNLRVNERTPVVRHVREEERLDLTALIGWRARIREVADELGFELTRWHTFCRREPSTLEETGRRFEDRTGWGNQLGIGMSARSRLEHVIYRNHRIFNTYLERLESGASPVQDVKVLNTQERKLRFIALTLGDGKPLDHAAYADCFSSSVWEDFRETLERLGKAELIAEDNLQITLTERGQLVYDLAMRAFYPESIRQWLDDRQHLAQRRS